MMLNPDDISGEYVRLRAESLEGSLDTQDAVLSVSQHVNIHLPTTSSYVHYVPKRSGKYRTAWRSLIPFRKTKRTIDEVPLDKLGLFSYITSNWVKPFFQKSWNPSLAEGDLVSGSPSDSSDINGQRFKVLLTDDVVKRGLLHSSLGHVVWLFIKTRVILASFLSLMGSLISIIGLMILLHPFFSISGQQTSSNQRSTVWIYPSIFIFAQLVAVFLQSWSTSLTYRTAVRLKSAYLTMMYRHLLQVSVLSSVSVQQIVTMMPSDSQRLFHAVTCVPTVITAVLVFIISAVIIIWICASSLLESFSCELIHLRLTVVNIAACSFAFPFMYMIAKTTSILKSHATNIAGDRLIKLHEMLSHIRLVKMACWEKLFTSKIKDFHQAGCKFQSKSHIFESFGDLTYSAVPVISAMLLVYTNITITVFIIVLILLLVSVKDSLHKFWTGVIGITAAEASLERLRCVLLLDKSKQTTEKPMNRLVAVAISNANFTLKSNNLPRKHYMSGNCFSCRKFSKGSYELEKDEELEVKKGLLTNISFSAPKGKLIGICGPRGSGKTTLVLAILGHLNLGYGKVFREGMFSYVSQNPWIWDATLRDNILFSEIFNHKRYYQVIHCCSLNDDIQHLPGGDQTKLHAKSLSLGQRQRVAVARALYAYRDICLFDDFLSALDEKIASEIFEKAILTHLREKTVIMTSQRKKFLSHCDEIYLLEEGEIIARGSYEELLSTAGDHFSDLLDNPDELLEKNPQESKQIASIANSMLNVPLPSVMVEDEDNEQTDSLQLENFSSSILMVYVRRTQAISRMISSTILGVLFLVLVFTSGIGCALMKSDASQQEFTPSMLWVPSSILLIFASSLSGSIILYKMLQEMSLMVHNTWLEKICSASILFFQENSVSDIMKWFSAYLQEIDMELPLGTVSTAQQFTFGLLSILIIILTSAWFLIPLIITGVLSVLLYRILRPGLTKLQNLEEESNKPLYSFIASTLTGRVTIQAYGKEKEYLARFVKHCDVSAACTQLVSGAVSWFTFRIQMVSVLAMALLLGLMIAAHMFDFRTFLFASSPFNESASLMEITILYMLILGSTLQHTMQTVVTLPDKYSTLGQLDARIRNIQRISRGKISPNLPVNWPSDGGIVFINVKVKCWSHSPSSSKGLTLTIQPSEKVGIVGLPGSQLQSIVDILYRLVDLSQGSVYLGGTDISQVPLEKLYASIALIPDNPIFLSGSLRKNMDPELSYSDSELQESLERVSMWDVVKSLPRKLETKVELLEDKLSVSERLRIYVAQAILKDPKVIVLEESYPSNNTGSLNEIHDLVKRIFTTSTVLIVAHSIVLVSNCNRVAVVKDGQLVEYDTLQKLFGNSKSHFSKMFSESTGNLFETPL